MEETYQADKYMNVFENPTMRSEETEEKLAIEQAIEQTTREIRRKILEKTNNPEEAVFFNEKDQENLQMMDRHPHTTRNRMGILITSREAMMKVKENPQIINQETKPRIFCHPKKLR